MIQTVNGDIFNFPTELICHQVNCMGVMGAGIAKEIRNRYPGCYLQYRKAFEENLLKLGYVDFYKDLSGITIASICGQYNYGRYKQQTDYDALTKGFKSIKDYCLKNNISKISIPGYICCVLAGGDCNIVNKIIYNIFGNENNINVSIYYLQNK